MALLAKINCIGTTLPAVPFAALIWSRRATPSLPCVTRLNNDLLAGYDDPYCCSSPSETVLIIQLQLFAPKSIFNVILLGKQTKNYFISNNH